MMTDHDINVGLIPILNLVMTLWMIMQKNVIPNWNYQFFTTCKAFITLSGLTYELEGLLVGMHHCTELLIQPDSLRLETI